MVQLRSHTSPEGIEWYRKMAAGGAGLVIVESTSTSRFDGELTPQNLKPLADAIHGAGAAAAIQLFMLTPDGNRAISTTGERTRRSTSRSSPALWSASS